MHTLTIKNLDQIQETARQFIKLMGDNPGEVHTFTVEFATSDGMVKTASITCTPEVDPALQ